MSKKVLLTEDPDYQVIEDKAALDDIESLFGGSSGSEGQANEDSSEVEEFAQGKVKETPKKEPTRVVEEDPNEDEYAEYEAEDEEPAEGLESEEESEESEEGSELQELRNEIARLKQAIEEKGQEEVLDRAKEEFVVEEIDFLKDIDVEDLYSDTGPLKKVLQDVFSKAVTTAREMFLKEMPGLVTTHGSKAGTVAAQQTLRAAKFYSDNPDIDTLDKEYVRGVANNLVKRFPNWDGEKLMTELPKIIRKELKLKPPVAKAQAGSRSGLKPTGVRRTAPLTNDMEKEIDSLLNLEL